MRIEQQSLAKQLHSSLFIRMNFIRMVRLKCDEHLRISQL